MKVLHNLCGTITVVKKKKKIQKKLFNGIAVIVINHFTLSESQLGLTTDIKFNYKIGNFV